MATAKSTKTEATKPAGNDQVVDIDFDAVKPFTPRKGNEALHNMTAAAVKEAEENGESKVRMALPMTEDEATKYRGSLASSISRNSNGVMGLRFTKVGAGEHEGRYIWKVAPANKRGPRKAK